VRLLGAAHAPISLISILKEAMEVREVNRIYVPLVGLQVIALMEDLADEPMVRRRSEKFVIGKQGRFARPHVGEDRSSYLLTGVGRMANRIPVLAPARLTRLLQTTALNVIKPAMIKTPEPAILDPPVAQVRSSVGAANPQEPGAPFIVPEQDQIFTQDLHRHRRGSGRQLFRESHRLPVSPQQLSCRGPGTDSGQ